MQPFFVSGNVPVSLPLVQKQTDAAKRRVRTQSAGELLQLGVFAVFMILQSLAVGGGVGAVFAFVNGGGFVSVRRVLGEHVVAELILAFAGVGADLADEGLVLVSELVAAELVHAVTAVTALVTIIPERKTNVAVPFTDSIRY